MKYSWDGFETHPNKWFETVGTGFKPVPYGKWAIF
jgi:hypothetical protein